VNLLPIIWQPAEISTIAIAIRHFVISVFNKRAYETVACRLPARIGTFEEAGKL
jgi:hypothetical protein